MYVRCFNSTKGEKQCNPLNPAARLRSQSGLMDRRAHSRPTPRPLRRPAGCSFLDNWRATSRAASLLKRPRQIRIWATRLSFNHAITLANLAKTIQAGGCDIAKDAVRIWQWFTSPYPTMEEFKAGSTWPRISITPYLDTRNEFVTEPRPASTGMGIRELLVKDTIVEVDLICIDDGGKSVGFPTPEGVPSPLAGYSPAIRRGDWIFMAGEIPVDWVGDFLSPVHMGEPSALAKEARVNPYLWYGSEIEKQTEYVLWKLAKTAEAAGTTLDRAVKADVYIGHPSDYAGMEKVWKRWFPNNPPARCVIPYMGLGGKGSRVEIALTLLAKDSPLKIETVKTSKAPKPFSHEPQAVKVGNLLFLSQQLPCDENGSLIPEGARNPNFPYYGLPSQTQMRYMLKNVAAICEAASTKLENVVRRACFHDSGEHFAEAMAGVGWRISRSASRARLR